MFNAEPLMELAPRYNIAPTQPVLAARASTKGGVELALFYWGLVPHWSKGPDSRFSMINARAETVHEKPAYRDPFRYRRCLIPTEGFYEWKAGAGGKQPHFLYLPERKSFAMAGLWEHWQDAHGNELESCAIIVTKANSSVAPVHDRMPVILEPEQYAAWLDPGNYDVATLGGMLIPDADLQLDYYPVSKAVNSPRNEGAALMERA
jgi:putative SOS response-associated peptidase YedK